MKLKKNYALRNVAGSWIVIPLAEETLNFNGMLRLNDTAAFLWKTLENGKTQEEMAQALVSEYEVTYEKAMASVEKFLNTLLQAGCTE